MTNVESIHRNYSRVQSPNYLHILIKVIKFLLEFYVIITFFLYLVELIKIIL